MKNLLENVNETMETSTNSFLVELEFNDGVLGGNPKHPDVFRMHIESMVHDWEWLCKYHPMVARELQDYKAHKYMNTGEEE